MTADKEQVVWGIHGGRTGDADSLFLRHNVIALGWPEMGDLSLLPAQREAFKARVSDVYPGLKPGAVPNNAGQLFRFVHEMQVGDLVAYPSQRDRKIHIGTITGTYEHHTKPEFTYTQHRAVTWLKAVPRTDFSQGALYEVGSALSFFQLKNYADEFIAAATGTVAPVPIQDDAMPGADEIEETTRDFVLKSLAQELKGHPFAHFVAHLLNMMGYKTRVAPEGPDGGIDIVAHQDELGFEPPIIKVQVKSTTGSTGNEIAAALYGNVGSDECGLLVTLGTFTNQANNFARGKSNLRLIDGQELVDLVFEHYEKFDARYKGILPLRKVYVPEPLEEN